MKAIIEFDLNNTEDEIDYWMATNGHHAFRVLRDMDEYLRNKIKYADDSVTKQEIEALDSVRTELRNLADWNKIPFHIWEEM